MNEAPATRQQRFAQQCGQVHLTKHALQRGEERLRLNASGLTRAARKAMREGMPQAEARRGLWRWIEQRLIKYRVGNMTCIHHNVVFIIHDSRLLTVYPLPKEFHAAVAKWHARNPASKSPNPPLSKSNSGRPSGSLKDPHSGAMTPESPHPPLKSASRPLKSPVLAETRPGGDD